MKVQTNNELCNSNELKTFMDDIREYMKQDITELDDTTLIYKLIKTISKLPLWKQNMIYHYAMIGSYSGLARKLNLSVAIVHKYVNEIIQEIKQNMQ